mmetsp:Transcript_9086/g.20208  ORF Transcript_9086/g.20208 Transcript_9086/m.20208 type:complete len:746 (+) Transcript_9086:108-2345(+)
MQRRGGRGPQEPRTPTSRRDPDVNRERLIFCVSSLVGHRVTVKLRNNVIYEGLFHSCHLDGDASITLKLARRLPSEEHFSGEVIPNLIIPGKDFLQVSAVDVPSPCEQEDESGPLQSGAFTIDSDIAARRTGQAGRERELVPWNHGEGDEAGVGGLEDSRGGEASWDQFRTNEARFGIVSTYSEDLYTTKLDASSIPQAKREEAERIAREIENGQQSAEVEKNVDVDGDEEDMWSAVQVQPAHGRRKDQMLTGSSTAAPSQKGGRGRNSQDLSAVVPHVPLTKEYLHQHDSLQIPAEGFAREHRAKRSLITAHSPMRSPMVSEMKRINALNLEPALPKLDDKTRNDWINFKQSQTRQQPKPVQGCLKTEFQQNLEAFQKWEATKQNWQSSPTRQGHDHSDGGFHNQSGQMVPADGLSGGQVQQPATAPATMQPNGDDAMTKATSTGSSKPFTFNAGAASFTPSGMSPANAQPSQPPATPNNSNPAQASQMRKTPSSQPVSTFAPQANSEVSKKTLEQLLNPFLERTKGIKPETQTPQWPQATGPPYKEVLGTPTSSGAQLQGGATTMPATNWQPPAQAQGQMGGNPQGNMGQGFVMPAQGGQPQMYQMYPGGPGPVRPQGQGAPPQGQQQPQQMVFNQQGCAAQGQQNMQMQPGMMNAQGQQHGVPMGAMAPAGKFGGQPTMVVPMVMPANYGQFQPQVHGGPQGQGPCPQGMMPQQMYAQRPPMAGGQPMGPGGQMAPDHSQHG